MQKYEIFLNSYFLIKRKVWLYYSNSHFLCTFVGEMTELPLPFTEYTRQLMGEERFEHYMQSFEEEQPVSIRLNPKKVEAGGKRVEVCDGEAVAWCRNAYYLRHRPAFTMDPLFHAGCYYVQEAASMFLDEVLRQLMSSSSCLFPPYTVWTYVQPLVASRRCCVLSCQRTVCSTQTNPFGSVQASWQRM